MPQSKFKFISDIIQKYVIIDISEFQLLKKCKENIKSQLNTAPQKEENANQLKF